MENQYNYYHSEEPQNDSSYSSQPNPEHHEKPKKKMPKAVVVTGCALLFGVVSSATFLTTNVVGNKVLGLDQMVELLHALVHGVVHQDVIIGLHFLGFLHSPF